MKTKKIKSIKKKLQVYENAFGFREPYQILVESDFIKAGLKYRLNIKELIGEALDGQVKLMVSNCTFQNLRGEGDEGLGALVAAKRFERRRCPHEPSIPNHQCISSIIGEKNKHRYIIASLDRELNKSMLDVPGVPTILLQQDTLVLAPPSKTTSNFIEQKTKEVPIVPKAELIAFSKITGIKVEKKNEEPKHKAKRAKGPNPLSMKKKTRVEKPKVVSTPTKKENCAVDTKVEGETKEMEIDVNKVEGEEKVESVTKPKRKRKRKVKPEVEPTQPEQIENV